MYMQVGSQIPPLALLGRDDRRGERWRQEHSFVISTEGACDLSPRVISTEEACDLSPVSFRPRKRQRPSGEISWAKELVNRSLRSLRSVGMTGEENGGGKNTLLSFRPRKHSDLSPRVISTEGAKRPSGEISYTSQLVPRSLRSLCSVGMTRGENGSVGTTRDEQAARSIDKRERAAEGVGPYGRALKSPPCVKGGLRGGPLRRPAYPDEGEADFR